MNHAERISVEIIPNKVLLRPGDAAILVYAARGVVDIITRGSEAVYAPSACISAVSTTVDESINRLIEQLNKASLSDGKICVNLEFKDRKFFAEALFAYRDLAREKAYLHGQHSEACTRGKAIVDRYADIYQCLGGRGWTDC